MLVRVVELLSVGCITELICHSSDRFPQTVMPKITKSLNVFHIHEWLGRDKIHSTWLKHPIKKVRITVQNNVSQRGLIKTNKAWVSINYVKVLNSLFLIRRGCGSVKSLKTRGIEGKPEEISIAI